MIDNIATCGETERWTTSFSVPAASDRLRRFFQCHLNPALWKPWHHPPPSRPYPPAYSERKIRHLMCQILTKSRNIWRPPVPLLFIPQLTWTSWRTWEGWMAEECSSSSAMIPGALLVVEGYFQWAGAQGEVEGHLAEAVGVAEEASYHQEVVEEVGLFLQSLVEAPGRQGGRGQQEGRQEQQLPASAETHGNTRGVQFSWKEYCCTFNGIVTTKKNFMLFSTQTIPHWFIIKTIPV